MVQATKTTDAKVSKTPAAKSASSKPAAQQTSAGGDVRGRQRELVGVVHSTKAQKTAIVEVSRRVLHPKYKKYLNRRMHYMAHDERSECREGDKVLITSCRPLSRHKRWRVQKIIERMS